MAFICSHMILFCLSSQPISQPSSRPLSPILKPVSTKSVPPNPSHTFPLSVPSNPSPAAVETPLDFSSPVQFTPCLDTSAARHRMSIKPRNQRASTKKRITAVSYLFCHLTQYTICKDTYCTLLTCFLCLFGSMILIYTQ